MYDAYRFHIILAVREPCADRCGYNGICTYIYVCASILEPLVGMENLLVGQ